MFSQSILAICADVCCLQARPRYLLICQSHATQVSAGETLHSSFVEKSFCSHWDAIRMNLVVIIIVVVIYVVKQSPISLY